MQVDDQHRLTDVEWRWSDHSEARPPWAQVDLIVVHCVSLPEGEFGTGAPLRLFLGELDTSEHPSFTDLENLRVAPHLFIDRDGLITQLVPFDRAAWHAGVSQWCGRTGCNAHSIGIELEGSVTTSFTKSQYNGLAVAIAALCRRYPTLSPTSIVGHAEIAPGRKLDPGPFFDWSGLLHQLQTTLSRAEDEQ